MFFSVTGAQVVSEETIIEDLKSGETLLHCARTLQIIKSEKDAPGKTLLAEREIKNVSFSDVKAKMWACAIFDELTL